MKKILLLSIICSFLFAKPIAAQDFIVTITNKVATNSKLTFDVNIQTSPGSGSIAIDNADFYFSYNTTYLHNQVRIASGMGGTVGTFGTNLAINIQGFGDHTLPSRIVTETPRLVCSVQFDVSPSQTGGALDNLACNGNGGVFKLDNADNSIPATYSCSVSSNIVLPLTLLDFSAKPQKDNIVLNWQTANEINFSGFELQRGTDAQNFSAAAEVKGKGAGDYVYNDFQVQAGQLYYYRLKMLDRDGSFSFSSIKSATIVGQTIAKLFPNPTKNNTRLNIYAPSASEAEIKIFNTQGQVLQTIKTSVAAGQNDVPIDLSNLVSGMYYVVMNVNNQQFSLKVNKE